MATPATTSPSKRKPKRDTRADGKRWYEVPTEDGTDTDRYPSVTTVLGVIGKPALLHWMAKQEREMVTACAADLYEDSHGTPRMSRMAYLNTLASRLTKEKAGTRAARKAAEIGSNVHALIEWTLRDELGQIQDEQPVLQTDEAKHAFAQWQEWRDEVDLQPVRVEQTVWSRRLRYAGTLDLLATVGGELAVLDWKTGKAVYPEARIQIAAYAAALIEMRHATKLDGYVVRLPKTKGDGFEVAKVAKRQHAELMAVFEAARRIWDFLEAA